MKFDLVRNLPDIGVQGDQIEKFGHVGCSHSYSKPEVEPYTTVYKYIFT